MKIDDLDGFYFGSAGLMCMYTILYTTQIWTDLQTFLVGESWV